MGYIHILQPTSQEENIIKDTPTQMAFKPTDTISHLTEEWDNTRNEFEQSGVHKLTYHTCGLADMINNNTRTTHCQTSHSAQDHEQGKT